MSHRHRLCSLLRALVRRRRVCIGSSPNDELESACGGASSTPSRPHHWSLVPLDSTLLMSQPSSPSAAAAPSTAHSSSALTPKVSFSFHGSSSRKPQLAAGASSVLDQQRSEEGIRNRAADGSASVLAGDGSESFESLSAIASASASPSAVPLVIPLKQSQSWRDRALSTATSATTPAPSTTPAASSTSAHGEGPSTATINATTSSPPLPLQQQAEQQLIASATPTNSSATATLPAELYTTLSIPLHQQPTAHRSSQPLNPAPLPAAATAAAVTAADEPRYVIPLEEYGVALLRGMGWKGPGDAVGGANKADVQPVLMKRREERMGLGADTAAAQNNQLLPHQRPLKEADGSRPAVAGTSSASTAVSRPQSAAAALRARVGSRVLALASQQLRVGALVYIAAGRHRRQYGRVTEMIQRTKRERATDEREKREDEDTKCRLDVKLNSGEHVSVDGEDVDVLDERALPDDHPAFGKVKREEEERRQPYSHQDRTEEKSSRHETRKSEDDDRPDKRHKPSHSPTPSRSSSARHASTLRSASSSRPEWCAPQLRVRIVSRSLGSSSCFRCKARVVDVAAASSIELLLDDGRTLTASEQQLETVIPSEKGVAVQVVRGKLKGQMGELIERDSKRSVAVVQLEDDLQVYTLDFDDICERVR